MRLEDMDFKQILQRKLKAIFPDAETRAEAISILDSYGERPQEKKYDVTQTRLSILKLIGPNASLEDLRTMTRYAKQDPRDINTWAIAPNLGTIFRMDKGPKRDKLKAKDEQVYLDWLNS